MNREELEKNALIHALQSGNVTRAAEIMGISRHTFYRKMKKYQIF